MPVFQPKPGETDVLKVGREAAAWCAEQEIALDDGVVLLRRVIDASGRSRGWINGVPATLTQLREAGWQIDYAYDDDAAAALPARLTLSRDQEIELRLRIEEWKESP